MILTLTDEQLQSIKEKLQMIKEKRGRYSMDILTHAENTINDASENAEAILKILEEATTP